MLDIDRERRAVARLTLRRPCKIVDPRSGRSYAGTTCNVSAGSGGGVLVRFDHTLPFAAGDRLAFGLCDSRRHALVRMADLVEADVVRRGPSGSGETVLALHFAEAVAPPVRRAA